MELPKLYGRLRQLRINVYKYFIHIMQAFIYVIDIIKFYCDDKDHEVTYLSWCTDLKKQNTKIRLRAGSCSSTKVINHDPRGLME